MKACVACNEKLSIDAKFCAQCGTAQPKELICPDCSYANESNSKFCQECGRPFFAKRNEPKVTKLPANEVQTPSGSDMPPPPAKDTITIEFAISRSQSFDFALAEAKKFSTFQQFGEGKSIRYRVSVPPGEIASLTVLVDYMKGWRNRFVYLEGERVPWDTVFSHLWCYEQKLASYKPEFYCFGFENEWNVNPWGCLQANLPFREGSDWFTWGKWQDNNGTWEFDKQRIRHELEKNMYSHRFCPAMNTSLVETVLATIPDTVNPKLNNAWQFVERWEDDGLPAIRVVTKDEWGTDEKFLVGVEPKGRKALEDLAKAVGFRLR